jgi:hypothetical protein
MIRRVSDFFIHLGGHNETRLGYRIKLAFLAGGSGLSSMGRSPGRCCLFLSRGRGCVGVWGFFSRLTTGPRSAALNPTKVRRSSFGAAVVPRGLTPNHL